MKNSVPSEADIVSLIQTCGRELSDQEEFDTAELTPDTILFGPDGVLDSLGLVSIIVALEQAMETEYGVLVTLADQRAMSRERSPFRSVRALAAYAAERVRDVS